MLFIAFIIMSKLKTNKHLKCNLPLNALFDYWASTLNPLSGLGEYSVKLNKKLNTECFGC